VADGYSLGLGEEWGFEAGGRRPWREPDVLARTPEPCTVEPAPPVG
jgi:hypothetical protein